MEKHKNQLLIEQKEYQTQIATLVYNNEENERKLQRMMALESKYVKTRD